MKKFIFLLHVLLVINFNFTFANSPDFPGTSPEILLGQELIVKEMDVNLQKYGYSDFYMDKGFKKIYSKIRNGYSTKYESLVNKVFSVISVDTIKVEELKSEYRLTLRNDQIGILYYKYEGIYGHFYPFKVKGGLQYPKGFLCNKIKIEKDKFTDKIIYRTPLERLDEAIIISKIIENKIVKIYMSISITALTLNLSGKGVILLLSNGEKIERIDAKVTPVVYDLNQYLYSSSIQLSDREIELLTSNEITDIRLHIHDKEIMNGKKYLEYLKCLIEKQN